MIRPIQVAPFSFSIHNFAESTLAKRIKAVESTGTTDTLNNIVIKMYLGLHGLLIDYRDAKRGPRRI